MRIQRSQRRERVEVEKGNMTVHSFDVQHVFYCHYNEIFSWGFKFINSSYITDALRNVLDSLLAEWITVVWAASLTCRGDYVLA